MDVKRRITYFYDSEIGNYYYGKGHPMKPHRIRMVHDLIVNYNLFDQLEVLRPPRATEDEMTRYHSDDYINFLKVVSPNSEDHYKQVQRFNVGDDCPVFDGMYNYCQIYTGGSLQGAIKLNSGESDIVINWAGGLHHAKKSEASGFCYVNDAVIAILELLKIHKRVLYIDIDIHHGDGVEEAFYTTDRVMTVSFHKYGEFFPGTGALHDIGASKGKYYSVNVPLKEGIDDETYKTIFNPVIQGIMDWYKPEAVVLQCGADSLTGDRLGCFNLTIKGHAQCIKFVQGFNLPTLLIGGGGYTIRNVARCWTYETASVLNVDVSDELPHNEYIEYYGPEFKLHIPPNNMTNQNSVEYIENIRNKILQNLKNLTQPGSVLIPEDTPPTLNLHDKDLYDEEDPEIRISSNNRDKHIAHDGEMSDSEEDDDIKPRKNEHDFGKGN
eukprot:TRINITY_DN4016_c0_g1_i1.p1 TRINITY_DN4016_c0_g1~~TRINITY_DN4016_c0_g1_i1.p1  ORF type:complete len:439 (+),score=114.37 TRINITY_DN4016_c0_g1_i1:40-1356(+)